MNDNVSKDLFDHSPFKLQFPTIDNLATEINAGNNAFRNTRENPANILKFGIQWEVKYYIDVMLVFSWVHGCAAFQMVSDTIICIMAPKGLKVYTSLRIFSPFPLQAGLSRLILSH